MIAHVVMVTPGETPSTLLMIGYAVIGWSPPPDGLMRLMPTTPSTRLAKPSTERIAEDRIEMVQRHDPLEIENARCTAVHQRPEMAPFGPRLEVTQSRSRDCLKLDGGGPCSATRSRTPAAVSAARSSSPLTPSGMSMSLHWVAKW